MKEMRPFVTLLNVSSTNFGDIMKLEMVRLKQKKKLSML